MSPRTDHNSGYKSPEEVRAMFGRIAARYDLMNRLMTFGQDLRWRRFMVSLLDLSPGASVLDIATGTGDIALEVKRQYPTAQVIAADFALPMMLAGRGRSGASDLAWSGADAMNLAFGPEHFQAVTSGYLFRNVPDVERAFAEQYRILKPGGILATLDTTPPPDNFLKPFIVLHLKYGIPTLGRLISPDPEAYAYLPASTMRFQHPDDLAALMRQAGFVDVQYRRFMFGTMAVHWGRKPAC